MKFFGMVWLTAAGAAVAAYAGNLGFFRMAGRRATATWIPLWEEACKVMAAGLLPGQPVLLVHLLFGVMEFLYDWYRIRGDGFFMGVLTACCHGLCGGLAALAFQYSGSLWAAYAVAALTHCAYNTAVLHLVLPALGAAPAATPGKR